MDLAWPHLTNPHNTKLRSLRAPLQTNNLSGLELFAQAADPRSRNADVNGVCQNLRSSWKKYFYRKHHFASPMLTSLRHCSIIPSERACRKLPGSRQRKWEARGTKVLRSEEHTSELQSRGHLVCRLLLEKKKKS